MQSPYTPPQEHIDLIRSRKFGLAPDGTIAKQNPLSDDLQRAISHLSEGLYSKETHFILELIQNAEDNRYDENVKPDLTFTLLSRDPTGTPEAEGALLVINNEVGFRPKDVQALCAVGATTKEKREGYVGEKGIGFKSVFVVSSQPHIFSGGYQFRFQEEPDPQAELGYIVPYWVSEIPPEMKEHSNRTRIVLPLKPGKREGVTKELETIAPETILFLSKLEGLAIHIENQKPIEVIRDDTNRPLVQFMTGDQYVEFWLVEQEIPMPPDLHEEKREGITTRKVSVALPLTTEVSSEGQVFAFLPTKEKSGFPFIINADFILLTSREGIKYDCPWNLWLRDCMAPAFIQAFTSLLDKPKYRARAYAFIPLASDNQEEFFQPTVEAIHNELSSRAVIWTLDGETLVKPSEARLASDEFRRLLNIAYMPTQLQKTPLAHPQIQTYRKQLEAIGVEDLSSSEIIECLRDETWLESQDLEWFVALYKYLSQLRRATEKRLQGLNLLPLEEGRRSNATEQPIYFPAEDVQEIRQLQTQVSSVLTIAFLNPRLYALLDDNQGLAQWLVDTLGVRDLTPANFCLDLARGLNEHRAEVSVSELVHLTAYIRDQFDALDDETQQAIIDVLPLALADGEIVEPQEWNDDHPLAMPEAMNPKTGWQLVFADPDDRAHIAVLSDAYLASCEGKGEFRSWQGFLEEVGATDAPHPRLASGLTYGSPELTKYERGLFKAFRDQFDEKYPRSRSWPWPEKVQDYRPPGWLSDLWTGTSRLGKRALRRRGKALVSWLAAKLRERYWKEPSFCTAHYEGDYRKWQHYQRDSELKHCLLEAPWFPSTQGPTRPGEVFLNKPELRELFGDTLPYVLENPGEKVANWLGLRQTATVDEFLQYLQELSSRPADQVDQKVVSKIYAFLVERWRSDVKDLFEEHPLILVSKPHPRWITSKQAIWRDLSAVSGVTYAYLEKQFDRRLKEFFVKKVGVREHFSQELYAQAWTQLTEVEHIQAGTAEDALERIYPELLKVVEGNDQPQWWQGFRANAKVWTQNDRFEVADRVYVPDDGELKRLFAKEGVEFAWRPEKASFAEYQPLYRALGIRSLVETVEATAEVQQVAETDDFHPLLTSAAKKAICVYLWNVNSDQYERTKQTGVLEALLRTREQVVKGLTVCYELDWTAVEVCDSSAYWQQDKRLLYRSDAHSQDQLEIETPAILARRLTGGRTSNALENFIGRVLGASEVKVDGISHKNNWSLPAEEKEWIDKVLASSLRQAEPEPKPKPEPKTEPETEAASPRSKHELRGEHESKYAPKPAPQPGPRPEPEPEPEPKPRPKPEPHHRRPRLRSYIEPDGSGRGGGSPDESELSEERKAIERAGIEVALAYEQRRGRIPKELPPNHEGWDIDSYAEDPVAAILDKGEKHRLARRIEVKATKYGWDGWGIGLTAPEYRAAQRHGEEYYLYVVEYALDENLRRLFVFQNPVDKVNDYRLDDRWKAVADEEY
ncbi:MAG: DUF3883 domain-containing protein [Anaerolineae bacterium]|nr:DUF3883 domain-containing protein [Anaerolineae bacterium]